MIGCTLSSMNDLNRKVFSAMNNDDVDMITFTKEKRILSFVVDEGKVVATTQAIHTKLFG